MLRIKDLDPEMWLGVAIVGGFILSIFILYIYQLIIESGLPITNVNF